MIRCLLKNINDGVVKIGYIYKANYGGALMFKVSGSRLPFKIDANYMQIIFTDDKLIKGDNNEISNSD